MRKSIRKKIINQVIAPISGRITHIEKRGVFDGWNITIMGDKDTRVYIGNLYCSKNDLNDYKIKEGKKVEAGQIILEYEER